MTKDELYVAQFLYGTVIESEKRADELDPKRKRDTELVRTIDTIGNLASRAFYLATGRFFRDVGSMVELHALNPAPWTKDAGPVEKKRKA